VPTVVTSHFFIDLPTLFAVTVFVSATGGLLLLFAWMQNRGTPALALWGIGYLFGAAAAAFLASPGFIPNSWSVCTANALICGAYGMMWGGARSFEGRRVDIALLATGAARKASIRFRAASSGWPCFPLLSGATAQPPRAIAC